MFKPMLAPNDQPNLDDIKYPILASFKLDGIRCAFVKGEMLSRSLKPIQNKQLREKFQDICEYSKKYNLILDGEIYSPDLTFQKITRYVMTQDFEDKKSIKKFGEVLTIPESLKFHVFDCVVDDNFDEKFEDRIVGVEELSREFGEVVVNVDQEVIYSKAEIDAYFNIALENGYEGLILKSHEGKYKCGRGTIKEGLIYKVKPFVTFDAVIKEVKQGTVVDPKAEVKINELGRSVTSKKKDDRILVDKVSDFIVDYEGHSLKVSCSSLTHDHRQKYWKVRESLIGKTIEYKGMLIGSKDVPRHPVFIRFREDKDHVTI